MSYNKRERFEKIAGSRVQAIIDKLYSLSKCSNRNNYSYTEEDVKKMFIAIREAVKKCEGKFIEELEKQEKSKFKF